MKSLSIKNSHIDFEYLDLELNSGQERILVNLYNSDNFHPNWIIENQLDSIIKQIESFYNRQKGKIKEEMEILIDIFKDGKASHMLGLVRVN